ncbi:hypothetical protein NQ318_004857 [Aromia moschata]|uniref:Uncharacterized protein n=1 Tax=Aromia moschata TaxID=1265417 RepID=A0AAV8Z2T9_9CUCU|nr:hypothetical protein NQ318_004857 [Aromia moschata]
MTDYYWTTLICKKKNHKSFKKIYILEVILIDRGLLIEILILMIYEPVIILANTFISTIQYCKRLIDIQFLLNVKYYNSENVYLLIKKLHICLFIIIFRERIIRLKLNIS